MSGFSRPRDENPQTQPHDQITLYDRGNQALKIGLQELEQMRPETRYYYLKELWYIASPDHAVFHRGPNQRRNKNIVWLFKRRYIEVNECHESIQSPYKYYIATSLGRELLACFTEEQLEEWKKSTATHKLYHSHWNSDIDE